jgi:ribosomal protein RSM22 (predicted rRNA methylase)
VLDRGGLASLLDVGCGPGTAALAALAALPDLASITLADNHPRFLAFAAAALAVDLPPGVQVGALPLDLLREPTIPSADVVTVSYALTELPEAALLPAAQRLWQATRGLLVLVEPGTPAAHLRLMRVREALLAAGAVVLAPCPHASACPLGRPDWCHMSARVQRTRLHKLLKGGDVPYEDERFAYLVLGRAGTPVAGARVIAPVRPERGGITARLCTPAGVAERHFPRRDKAQFRHMRHLAWGDGLPPG